MKLILSQIIIWFVSTAFASQVDERIINQFKSYLREIKSIAVEFDQIDSNSDTATGKLIISKPYKFRCNYYPPYPLLIVGNKNYVSVYDYDMEQVSRIKAHENVFNFLLVDDLDFDKYFQFQDTFEDKNSLKVTLYHIESERRSDNNIITIKFGKIMNIKNIDDDLFILKNPDIFDAPTRLDKTQLEKKYKLAS
jgi:outer membrane lipoprotein-sorting protein